jgi:hypothetical protein
MAMAFSTIQTRAFSVIGELLAAASIVIGGGILTGLATLVC